MASHGQPPNIHISMIKCWWVPLELQSFGTRTNFPKKDDSVSCTDSAAQSERKPPIGGLSTAKLASTLAGIWDYVGDPPIFQTKENMAYHDILQNEDTMCYSHEQRKRKLSSSKNQRCHGDHGSTSSLERASDFDVLQIIKKQLLFASCSRVISTAFITKIIEANNSHFLMDSPENSKIASVGAPSNLASRSGSIEKKLGSEDLVEFTADGEAVIPLEKNSLVHVSSNNPCSKTTVKDEDALSEKAMKLGENDLQTPATFNCTYSIHSMERAKEAIIVLKNPDSDIHLGNMIDLSLTECTDGQYQEGTDSSLIAECSVNFSKFKDRNLHEIDRYSCHESTLYPQHIKKHLYFMQEKLQNVLAENRYALSGAMAGTLVSLCLHPIDTVKTVIQSNVVGHSSSRVLRQIIAEKGFFGLYRGIASSIASSAPISAIYTFTYESVKGALLPFFPKEYHSFIHCFAGACSSIATSVIS